MKISYLCLCASLLLGCAQRQFNESDTEAKKTKMPKIDLPTRGPNSEYKWKLDAKNLTGELFLDGKSIFKGKIIEGKAKLGYTTDFINSEPPSLCGSFELIYGPDGYHRTDWRDPDNIYGEACKPTFLGAEGMYKGDSPKNDGTLIRTGDIKSQ